jgi:hypothetical protein
MGIVRLWAVRLLRGHVRRSPPLMSCRLNYKPKLICLIMTEAYLIFCCAYTSCQLDNTLLQIAKHYCRSYAFAPALPLRVAIPALFVAGSTSNPILLTFKARNAAVVFWSFFTAEKGLRPRAYERK